MAEQPLSTHSMSDQIQLEPAQPEDAAAVLNIHCAAVHQTAAPFYPENVINRWARLPIDSDRIKRVGRKWIENPDRRMIVAKQNHQVLGFGFMDMQGQVQGLYVHPEYGRRGIGTRILAALEQTARLLRISVLKVDAAINAEAFYIKQEFSVIEYATHQLSSGQEMACIKMKKNLSLDQT
jgi:putative acetyltransferase